MEGEWGGQRGVSRDLGQRTQHTVYRRCVWNCAPATCILLLTSVTPINAIKRRQKIRSFILLYYYHNDIAVKLYLQMQRKKKFTKGEVWKTKDFPWYLRTPRS